MIVDRAREESIMFDQLQEAIDLDPHGIVFVFTDSAEKTAKVRSLAEKRLCLAPHGSFESANRDLLDTNCGGIVLDLGLIHDLIEEPVVARDGMVAIPDGPGLGFTISESFLGAHVKSC